MQYRCEQLVGSKPSQWEFIELIRGSSPEAALESMVRIMRPPRGRYRCIDADDTVTEMAVGRRGAVVVRP